MGCYYIRGVKRGNQIEAINNWSSQRGYLGCRIVRGYHGVRALKENCSMKV